MSDRTPWLIVQPSGAFPLVGPIFNPDSGPCWTCLFDRMIRNREVKGFLERGSARAVAISPLARQPLGQGAIQFSALEVAKAIATGFRTDLNDHIVSHDLLGSTVVKHYVAKRPQCPTCGSKKLRDPRRSPTPVELGPGARLMMTSGGYRTVSSRSTVARFRKHVSPLTGVVTRLERIEADLPMNTNFFAGHNFSGPALTVDALRSGLTGGSFGKGSTAEQGEASALMEAIERYSGIFQGDEIRTPKRFTDFSPGEAIHPNDVLLFSDAQYQAPENEPPDSHPVPPLFDPSARMEWSPAWSLRDQCFRYLPTSLMYFFYGSDQPGYQRRFQWLRRRQHAGRGHRSGLSRTGRTRFIRHLVVQPRAARRSRPRSVQRFLRPRSAKPACRFRATALGARHHQRSRRSHLCRDNALDAERA